MDEMQTALERIEARSKRANYFLGASIGLIALVAVFEANGEQKQSAPIADVIRTRRIEVVNPHGQVVFAVSTDPADSGVMELNYASGKPLLGARVADFGPALAVCATDGSPLVILGQNYLDKGGGGMVQVISKEKKPVVWATTNTDGDGRLLILDRDGKPGKDIGPKP